MASPFARTGLVAVLVTLLCLAGSASAATFDVNSTKDLIDADPGDGTCAAADDEGTDEDEAGLRTLRACIMEANHLDGEDAINVPEGWYKLTLRDANLDEGYGDLDITDPDGLTVDGTGDPLFTVVDANGIDRGVELNASQGNNALGFGIEGRTPVGTASIVDMTIRNGFEDSDDEGGGIQVDSGGELTLTRSLVIHNVVESGDGGGIHASNDSTLTLNNTVVERNTAEDDGGGIFTSAASSTIDDSSVSQNIADSDGGGMSLDDSDGDTSMNQATITDSAVDNNRADNDGGGIHASVSVDVEFGSEPPTGNALTLERSSVSNNSSDDHGGGIYNDNSFAFRSPPQQTDGVTVLGEEEVPVPTDVVNSTLSGNIADDDVSGVGDGGAVYNEGGEISILNATIVDGASNSEDSGGAIYADDPVAVKNTILATSITAGDYDPCTGDVTSNGNNLQTEDDSGCGFDDEADDGDKKNADPRLGRLQNNGGPTRTRALLAGSAAIDAGTNDGCPATDQRGVGRPPANSNAGPTCDIGAYEVSSTPAPQQEQPPASTPQQQQQQCTPAAPRSSISRNSLQIEDNTVKLTGRSTDQLCEGQDARGAIRRVRLAIGLDLGSQCRFLRRNGNLGARRDCDSRQFINARLGEIRNGKVPWTFRLRGLDLPNGVYDLVALGVDAEGNAETRLRRFNHKRFRLR